MTDLLYPDASLVDTEIADQRKGQRAFGRFLGYYCSPLWSGYLTLLTVTLIGRPGDTIQVLLGLAWLVLTMCMLWLNIHRMPARIRLRASDSRFLLARLQYLIALNDEFLTRMEGGWTKTALSVASVAFFRMYLVLVGVM